MAVDPRTALTEIPEGKILVQVGWYCDMETSWTGRNSMCGHDNQTCGPTYAVVPKDKVVVR